MDIDALSAFVKVVNEKSFSLAAQALHLTQPAISKRIQNLESGLGVKLFERLQKEVILTEAGQTLLPHALAILHSHENALQAIYDMDQEVSGTLRIVASHHIGLHRLPLVLKEYSQRFPKVDLQLNFLDSESAYPYLKQNVADLGFITIPRDIDKGFSLHLKWNDPMSFICSKEHVLADLDSVSPVDLAEHNAILPSKSTLTYRVVEEIFRKYALILDAKIPTNYLETMKMMTSVGMGWSVLPNTMIDEELHVLPTSLPAINRQLGAISYQRKQLSQAARAFIVCAEEIWGKEA